MAASLLQHVAIATLLAVIVAVICRVVRPGPAVRHALWLVILIKLAMPPVVVVRTPWAWSALPDFRQLSLISRTGTTEGIARASVATQAPTTPRSGMSPSTPGGSPRTASPELSPDTITDEPVSVTARGPAATFSASALAATIWILGATTYLAIQVARVLRLRRWLTQARSADRGLVARLEALARRINLPIVPVLVVPALSSPLIWSIRRPVLLWPADLPPHLSSPCLDGLLVHELAHVRRRDHWVSWVELVAGAIWWWNPLFWYVRAQVREHAELACDACVVASLPQGRRAYAEALVTVCDIASRREAPVPAVGVSTGSRRVLERRLVMIMRANTSARLSRAACAAIAALIAATVPVWAQRATTPPAITPVTEPVTVVPRTEVAPEPMRPVSRPATTTVPTEPVRQALPSEALRLITRFEDDQARTRREADARLAQQRDDVVRQLVSLQESYARAGRNDDAAAIRDRIRAIQSDRRPGVSVATTPSVDFVRATTRPGSSRAPAVDFDTPNSDNLVRFRGQYGASVAMTVTGRTGGPVWGDEIYTDDSSLSTAAVHAGVLRPGETGTVRVTILPGRDSYDGSEQHGVRSSQYGEWDGSYRIDGATPSASTPSARGERRAPAATTPRSPESEPQPNLGQFRDHVWESFTITVVGSRDGSVWGTEIYTDDSSIATAAVHAGLLTPGERGTLKVTLLPGQRSYSGSDRHGVVTSEYGDWGGSFRLERVK